MIVNKIGDINQKMKP